MAAAAFAFDLDGTIWDSYPWYAGILGDLGKSDAATLLHELNGDGNVIRLMNRLGIARKTFLAECRHRVKAIPVYAPVRDTLDRLRTQSIPLGVASSLPGDIVTTMLDGSDLSNYFTSIVHRGNCQATKPNPRPVIQCLEGLGITPGPSACYVGDRQADQGAAGRAGVTFAWAEYGYGKGVILGAGEVRITDFKEILEL